MKVKYIRSDSVYQKIANASIEKKNDIYRYELMMPFKKKWDCYSVPMKASTPNGYDVIMASIRRVVRQLYEVFDIHTINEAEQKYYHGDY